jgi:hypothetical protein
MSANLCHEVVASNSGGSTPKARIAGGDPRLLALAKRNFAGWIAPASVLALLPKCPACLAAYFAAATGIGISLAATIYLRVLLATLCVAALSYFAVSGARGFIAKRLPSQEAKTTMQFDHDAVPRNQSLISESLISK